MIVEHLSEAHREVHAAPQTAVTAIFGDGRPRRILERAQLYRGFDDVGTKEALHLLSKYLSQVPRDTCEGLSEAKGTLQSAKAVTCVTVQM